MSLLAEIQGLLERTYHPAGVNLEHCLIGRRRSEELLAASGSLPSCGPACTFLRLQQDNLHIGIYYAPQLIHRLEAEDPRHAISHRNIRELIAFTEEATHGLHAALAFRSGFRAFESESFQCNMELQARLDTYYILLRFCRALSGDVPEAVRLWIRDRLFGDEIYDTSDRLIQRRYRLANRLAQRLVERLGMHPPEERLHALRLLSRRDLWGKWRWLRSGCPA